MNLAALLASARKCNASDIHMIVGLPIIFRIDGEIVVTKSNIVDAASSRQLAFETLNDEQKYKLEVDWQLCYSTSFGDCDRARITVYMRGGNPELSIRLSEREIRSRAELRLPEIVDELVRKPNGLIIITGPTGVGKTTTFHYMLDRINAENRKKIISIEDPIEYTHASKRSIVVQQEMLTDVHSFQSALVHALRQDPDVIGIGEMRERETMYTALLAAETGHLVIATLHTPDTVQAIQRIVSVFPEGQQDEIRFMLANCLQAIIAQQLLPSAVGQGRVLCSEVLIGTQGVRHHIRENSAHKIYTEMQAGRKFGMVTMDHALLDSYRKGDLTYDMALSMARDPKAIRERMT